MNKKLILFSPIVIIIPIIFSSCGSSTDLIGQWSDDQYKNKSIDKIVVLGIFAPDKPLLRRRFEDGISKAFIDEGVEATPRITSYNVCYTKLLRL